MNASTLKRLQEKKEAAITLLMQGAESYEDRLRQLDAVRDLDNVIRLQIRDDIESFLAEEKHTVREQTWNIQIVNKEIQELASGLLEDKRDYEEIRKTAIVKSAAKMGVTVAQARRLLSI